MATQLWTPPGSSDEALEKLWAPYADPERAVRETGMPEDQAVKLAESLLLPDGMSEPAKRGGGQLLMEPDELRGVIAGAQTVDEIRGFGLARARSELTRGQRAYGWIDSLIGEMPYGRWFNGIVPPDQPAFAVNQAVQAISYYRRRAIFCAAVATLMLRSIGKVVPTYGNPNYDGGVYAYGLYFRDYIRRFALHLVEPFDLLIRYFRFDSPDQGHVAVALPGPNGELCLQSFDGGWAMEGGTNGPGLNKRFTVAQSHDGGYYEGIVKSWDWINYRGDEGGWEAAA